MSFDRQKVISIALAEEGYLEKATNDMLDDKTANAGYSNYTKYARDLDNIPNFYNGKKNGYAYCDIFVDWCFVKAYGVENAKHLLCQPDRSGGAGCTYSAQYYKRQGQLFYKDPQIGDQIFFGNATESTHTGLVYDVDSSFVYTIEGNTNGASGVIANGGGVCRKKYTKGNAWIYAYGRPAYNDDFNADSEQEPETTGSATIQDMTSESNNYEGNIDTVKEVQIWLNLNYSAGLMLDGLYSDSMKKALTKELQKILGVEADGVFGDDTYQKCSHLDLHKGSTGNAVRILQAFLVCLGYPDAYVDGEFGEGTRKSLVAMQTRFGLEADGIAAQDTFKALCR